MFKQIIQEKLIFARLHKMSARLFRFKYIFPDTGKSLGTLACKFPNWHNTRWKLQGSFRHRLQSMVQSMRAQVMMRQLADRSSMCDVCGPDWGHRSCPVLKIDARPAGTIDRREEGGGSGWSPNSSLNWKMILAIQIIFPSLCLHWPHVLQSTYSARWTFCWTIDPGVSEHLGFLIWVWIEIQNGFRFLYVAQKWIECIN